MVLSPVDKEMGRMSLPGMVSTAPAPESVHKYMLKGRTGTDWSYGQGLCECHRTLLPRTTVMQVRLAVFVICLGI